MPIAISMPKLGMTMEEGTVIEWHVPLGESVTKGELLLTIESEKAQIEIEAPASGVLRHVYVESNQTVPCGTLLAVLTETADEPFDPESFRRATEPHPETKLPAASPAETGPQTHSPVSAVATVAHAASPPVTPAARRRAADLGVDAARIPGSGPGGRVTREDVEAYAEILAARVTVADGVALEVAVKGNGEPVILLPGFGADVTAFARQVPVLAERYRTLGINPRGVGLSDAPEAERYDVAMAAADAAAVARGPAHVVGASLGAAIAVEVALSHPECVRSLTLLTPFVRAGARLRAVGEAWCRLAAEASRETLACALVPWLFSPGFLADDARRDRAARALAQMAARVPARTLERCRAGMHAWSGNRESDLGRVSVPTLVIVAGEDLLTPDGEEIAESIPGARLVIVPEAGHAVGLEAPEAVNDAVLEHLATVDARLGR
jgi:pimeloyl-ACP methyl ester carboxylesterase